MPVDMSLLLSDLRDETEVVDALVADLVPEQWRVETPSAGWSIHDQVSHLAYFDHAATLAATEPERFTVEAEALMAHGSDFATVIAERYRSMPSDEVLAWFRTERAALLEVFAILNPVLRLPWYGLPMSPASSITARLMETWAHGLDIADALGQPHPPSGRLRHVAHLGVQTFGFAFDLRHLEVPTVPVFIDLEAPDGTHWTWGDPSASERVSGSALDFCLVVTQRRHRDDTELVVEGPVADRWLSIAQAFAGPPGPGRAPLDTHRGSDR
jgi:uncharacterized protein (TIGR03084 family)